MKTVYPKKYRNRYYDWKSAQHAYDGYWKRIGEARQSLPVNFSRRPKT